MDIQGPAFSPATLTIPIGDSVSWENGEPGFGHTTTSDLSTSDPDYWQGMMARAGDTISHTFNRAGVYSYHDQLDFGMGVVRVIALAARATLRAPRQQDGKFFFEATGLTAGNTNVLHGSTDLVEWSALGTNVAGGGSMSFTNAATPGGTFFRLEEAGQVPPLGQGYDWAYESPLPQGQELFGVSALDASNVWAVGGTAYGGAGGTVVHFDGSDWRVQLVGLTHGLFGVCAIASNHVWAVGTGGTILHYDGARWRQQLSGVSDWLYGVAAADATNVWAVGDHGTILHFDGTTWSRQSSGTPYQLRSISVADAANIWAAGNEGTILHYDGTQWSAQDAGTNENLQAISARTATDVWAVGLRSTLLHYDGVGWSRQEPPVRDMPLRGVAALAANCVWTVGPVEAARVFFYNGTQWSLAPINKGLFYAVSALDTNHVWMVGMHGYIVFYDGAQAIRQDQRAMGLRALAATGPDNAWAAGLGGTILHYNGAGWSAQTNVGYNNNLYGVAAADPDHAWAVGSRALILYYDGTTDGTRWSKQASGLDATNNLLAVTALGKEAWAVGTYGNLLHYDGSVWQPQASGTTQYLHGVSACAPGQAWAVGQAGTILHYDGTNWSPQVSGTESALYAVTALATNEVWAVGAFGTILHWEGTTWRPQVSGVPQCLCGVSSRTASEAWAVGGDGVILRWDGTNWCRGRRGYAKQDWFWSVCVAGTEEAWAAGFDGENFHSLILRGRPGGAAASEPIVATGPFPVWQPYEGILPAKLDLRGELPPVQNQTDILLGQQTCGPWSIGYYQLSQWIRHFRRPTWDMTRPEHWMSPAFIYCMGGNDYGGYAVFTNYGCVDLLEYPYEPSFTGPSLPTATQLEAAKPFRILGHEALWQNTNSLAPYPDADLQKAKTRLAQGYVLTATICVNSGDFPDTFGTPPTVFYDPPGKPLSSGHWVALCGYDDNINPSATDPLHRGGFLLVNCWGPHWNGEMHGFLWISYAWVKNYVRGAYALHGDGPNGPSISNCAPLAAVPGVEVRLTGSGFGGLRRQARVTFNGIPAPVVSFANESITVQVPPGATSGPLVVYDWEGIPSKEVITFTVLPGARTSF